MAAQIKACGKNFTGEMLFTHKGLSGPVIMDVSAVLAYQKLPFELEINYTGLDFEEQDKALIDLLNQNPHKNIENTLCACLPAALAKEFLAQSNIPADKKSHQINAQERKKIATFLTAQKLTVQAKDPNYMVTAGGVDLREIDNNLQSKITPGLYFAGEILDIDGLCGGFNLQACFSMGYVAGLAQKTP